MTSNTPFTYLVIDDDEHFARVLCRSLSRQGNTATSVSSLDEIDDQMAPPQRLIIDLRLGEASGLDAVSTLRQRWPDSQIVVLTGYASIPTAVEAIKRGADNYLHKPATIQELMRAFAGETSDVTNSTESAESAMSLEKMEWEHIQRTLNEHDGNISATARALNMHRRTLQRKLQKHAPR